MSLENMELDDSQLDFKEELEEPKSSQQASKILKIYTDGLQDKVDLYIDEYPLSDNLHEFLRFINENENPEINQQIYLRICQSIINRWDQKTTQKCKRNLIEMTNDLYEEFLDFSGIGESEFVEKLLVILSPLMKDLMGRFDANSIHHRNICLVLKVVLARHQSCFGEVSREKVLQYLAKIVEESQNTETVLYACFSVEALAWKQQISKELVDKLCKGLQKYVEYTSQCPISILSSTNFDRIKYQVGHCARWLIASALVDKKPDDDASTVKLSPDRLCARSDVPEEYPTVCCSFPVNQGVYYYEATLLTGGSITIGWATQETDFNEGIGSDQFSVGLDGYSRVVTSGEHQAQVDKCWKEGDVIGCLIDVPRQKFAFYLNGKKLEYRMPDPYFSSQSYYAVARLSPHQQVYFNFGQAPFKCPPLRGVTYRDFHSDSDGESQKYHLLVPCATEGSYWFRKELADNRVEPFFRDERQYEFDRFVIKMVCKIADNYFNQADCNQELEEEFTALMDSCEDANQPLLRLIQSVIEEVGASVKEDKIDIVVGVLERYLALIEPSKKTPNLAKFLELVYPYMQLQPKCLCDRNTMKHRNLCMVLSLMAKCDEETPVYIQNREVIAFINRILKDCELESSLLFAVICLDSINPDHIKLNSKLEELSRFLKKCTFESMYTPTFDFYRYQIAFCARWNLDRLLGQRFEPGEGKSKLDVNDMTTGVKVSYDRLCARSDSEWQSVRSMFPITSGIYFYEVILITSGSMRIGWATKECEFEEGKGVGNDEYSIGYDGFQKKICHIYGDYTLLKKNVRRWKAGDVVGCLIDVAEKKFAFYLNGELIDYQADVFFSKQSYFAAVSLSAHQHCYFNFGQAPFKYPPADVEIRDFHSAMNKNLCPFCGKKKAIARFASCDHWLVCLDCFQNLETCPTCEPTQA